MTAPAGQRRFGCPLSRSQGGPVGPAGRDRRNRQCDLSGFPFRRHEGPQGELKFLSLTSSFPAASKYHPRAPVHTGRRQASGRSIPRQVALLDNNGSTWLHSQLGEQDHFPTPSASDHELRAVLASAVDEEINGGTAGAQGRAGSRTTISASSGQVEARWH